MIPESFGVLTKTENLAYSIHFWMASCTAIAMSSGNGQISNRAEKKHTRIKYKN